MQWLLLPERVIEFRGRMIRAPDRDDTVGDAVPQELEIRFVMAEGRGTDAFRAFPVWSIQSVCE